MAIETVYHVRIDYDHPKDWEKVETALDPFLSGDSILRCHIMTGNPACFPYIEAEFGSMGDAEMWQDKVIRAIKKCKGIINP